jgi:hypothetical protein
MPVVFVVQMTVVQIVGMVVVFDGGMAATGAMGMIMMIVDFASHFDSSLSTVEFKPFRLRPYNILFWQISKQFLLY